MAVPYVLPSDAALVTVDLDKLIIGGGRCTRLPSLPELPHSHIFLSFCCGCPYHILCCFYLVGIIGYAVLVVAVGSLNCLAVWLTAHGTGYLHLRYPYPWIPPPPEVSGSMDTM